MPIHRSLVAVLEPAYAPCPAFQGACVDMRWDPQHGHVPRGFSGAQGTREEIELVLVVAEPGDPYKGESYGPSTYPLYEAPKPWGQSSDQYHRNLRSLLSACWPGLPEAQLRRRVWITESVLCSAATEGGRIASRSAAECSRRYLLPQLTLLSHATVAAFGSKAQSRLKAVGFQNYLRAFALAPPGCNFKGAKESWLQVAHEVRRRRAGRG
jgi:hypothetical protein